MIYLSVKPRLLTKNVNIFFFGGGGGGVESQLVKSFKVCILNLQGRMHSHSPFFFTL